MRTSQVIPGHGLSGEIILIHQLKNNLLMVKDGFWPVKKVKKFHRRDAETLRRRVFIVNSATGAINNMVVLCASASLR